MKGIIINEEDCVLKRGDNLYKYTGLNEWELNNKLRIPKNKMKDFKLDFKKIKDLIYNKKIWFSKYACLNDIYEFIRCEYNYPDRLAKDASNFRDSIIKASVEILALTKLGQSMAFWAHYANVHRGYRVELKVKEPEKLFKVRYCDEIEKGINSMPTVSTTKENEMVMARRYSTKTRDWEYEQEFRVINITGNVYSEGELIKLEEAGLELSKIAVGMKCNDIFATIIKMMCVDNNVECVRMKIKDNKLVEEDIPLPKSDADYQRFREFILENLSSDESEENK